MLEKELRPIEREIVEKFRAIDITGRGELKITVTPEAVDIGGGPRIRRMRQK